MKPAAGSPRTLAKAVALGAMVVALAFAAGRVRTLRSRPADQASSADPAATSRVLNELAQQPMAFEAAGGQSGGQFLARGLGYAVALSPTGAAFDLHGASDEAQLSMTLTGANPSAAGSGENRLAGAVNYQIGNDPAGWRTGIPTFRQVRYQGVYPGIDLVYYGNQHRLEYDFVVAAGADPSSIGLAFTGADRVEMEPNGDLAVHVGSGIVRKLKPSIYQEIGGVRHEVDGGYALAPGGGIGFRVGAYDPHQALVIDPTLDYFAYLGGDLNEFGASVSVDISGNAYVAGMTNSARFTNLQECANCAGTDAFVSKLSADGGMLLYTTYLGGSNDDEAHGVAADAAGNAYVTGKTSSSNFPTAGSPVQASNKGGWDGFVTRLNSSGAVVFSTYLGGSGDDSSNGIAVDPACQANPATPCGIYVTGTTASSNFPTAQGLPLNYYHNGQDAFVSKLNGTTGALVYSSYVGGGGDDVANGIAVDGSGNAYIVGSTTSTGFPVTTGAFQTACAGTCSTTDAFATQIDPTGNSIVYSTFLGGTGNDVARAVALRPFTKQDPKNPTQTITVNEIFIAGWTASTGLAAPAAFPTKSSVNASVSGVTDAFVTRIDPTQSCYASGFPTSCSALLYSTVFGGSSTTLSNPATSVEDTVSDAAYGIAVDSTGTAVVVGRTNSGDFPKTEGNAPSGTSAVFATMLSPVGNAIVYSRILEDSADAAALGVTLTPSGYFYVTGRTNTNQNQTGAAGDPAPAPPPPPPPYQNYCQINNVSANDINHPTWTINQEHCDGMNVFVVKFGAPGPAEPGNLRTGTITSTSIAFQWNDNSSNETGFQLAYKPSSSDTWSYVNSIAANATSYTLTGLTANTSYAAYVRACNAAACSGWSNGVTATTLAAATPTPGPATPTNMRVATDNQGHELRTETSITVAWDDNTTNETLFQVAFRKAADATWTYVQLPPNTTTFSVTGLQGGAQYAFAVAACVNTTCSGWSNILTTSSLMPSPTDLHVTAATQTALTLAWTNIATTATSLQLFYSKAGTATWTTVNIADPNTTTTTVSGLSQGTTYYFYLRACNDNGCGPLANVVRGDTKSTIPNPSNVQAPRPAPAPVNLPGPNGVRPAVMDTTPPPAASTTLPQHPAELPPPPAHAPFPASAPTRGAR